MRHLTRIFLTLEGIYKPLSTHRSEFRLVRFVEEGSAKWKAPGWELIHTSMEDMPEFTAVSYTSYSMSYLYGCLHPGLNSSIQLNEDGFGVREKVSDMLDFVRSKIRQSEQLFWIDVLCINMSDFEEKTRQIQLIGSIFAAARDTWVWLGADGPDQAVHPNYGSYWKIQKAFEVLEQLARARYVILLSPFRLSVYFFKEKKKKKLLIEAESNLCLFY